MNISFQKVESVTKKVRVVALVKDAIHSGELKPGEPLVETKIAQQFGVGQGLIREALIELEHQGFVQRIPFSGTQITEFNLEEAGQIFDVRMELEPLAFTLAGQKASPADLAELSELIASIKQSAEESNQRRFFELNLEYRRKVWALSGNKYLVQSLERLVVPLFALYTMREPFNPLSQQRMVKGASEQETIVKALQAGNVVEAGRLVRESLQEGKSQLHLLLK